MKRKGWRRQEEGRKMDGRMERKGMVMVRE